MLRYRVPHAAEKLLVALGAFDNGEMTGVIAGQEWCIGWVIRCT